MSLSLERIKKTKKINLKMVLNLREEIFTAKSFI